MLNLRFFKKISLFFVFFSIPLPALLSAAFSFSFNLFVHRLFRGLGRAKNNPKSLQKKTKTKKNKKQKPNHNRLFISAKKP